MSDYTRTPNYSLYKPVPDADVDAWGDHWNWNADTLDSVIHGIETKPPGGVTSWNTRTGAVVMSSGDVTGALGFTPYNASNPAGYITSSALTSYAPLVSPPLTGNPTAPTPAPGDNDTSIATTAFVTAALTASGGNFVKLTGDTMSGSLFIQRAGPALYLDNTTAGQNRPLVGLTNNKNRWVIELGNSTTESGGNTGSDFGISRWNDAGAYIDNPMHISRSTGIISTTQSLGLGLTPKTDAAWPTLFTQGISIDNNAPVFWNAYWQQPQSNSPSIRLNAGYAAAAYLNPYGDLEFLLAPSGAAGSTISSWPCAFRLEQSSGRLRANLLTVGSSTGGSDPMMIWTANGQYARIQYHVDGTRIWSAGTWSDGGFRIADESRGEWVLNCDTNGNVSLSHGLFANYVYSYVDMAAAGQITGNAMMNVSGTFYVANSFSYYLARNGSNGQWNFVENGAQTFTVFQNGDTRSYQTHYANGLFSYGRVYYSGAWDAYMGGGGSGRIFQFAGNWYWDWNSSNGVLAWVRGGGYNWVQHANQSCYNNELWVGGRGAYIDLSDERHKEHIEPASYGLDEILALKPIRFRRKRLRETEAPEPEVGFAAQDVQRVIPECIRHMEIYDKNNKPSDALGMATTPIVAALVRAVQQLAQRIEELEAA